mgnify:CR=1 FL=1
MVEGKGRESSAQGSKPQALTLRASRQGEGIPLGFPLFFKGFFKGGRGLG